MNNRPFFGRITNKPKEYEMCKHMSKCCCRCKHCDGGACGYAGEVSCGYTCKQFKRKHNDQEME